MNRLLPKGKRRWLILISVTLIALTSWLPQVDNTATQNVDDGLKRALVSFASARALNAAISVAQGTEASVEPAGVGFTFTPGEVLDPVNDLVEKFSDLMLLASLSFGVQKTLINIGGHWLVSLLLGITAALWIGLYLIKKRKSAWVSKLFVLLIMIRFAVPLVTYSSDLMFENFMSTEYETSQQFIDSSSDEIEEYNQAAQTTPEENDGIIDRIRNWSQSFSFESPVDKLKESADMAIEHIVNIMVIFLLQTLILPLITLWALYGFVKRFFITSN